MNAIVRCAAQSKSFRKTICDSARQLASASQNHAARIELFRKHLKQSAGIPAVMSMYAQLKQEDSRVSSTTPFLSLPGYSELISRLAHANDLSAFSSASRSILGDMESHGLQPDNATFLALIRGYAGAGELTTASKYLERMLKLGNRKPRLRSFTPLLHAAYRREDLPFAVDIWRLMQQHRVAPSEAEVASLLALLVKKGQQQTSLDKDGDELLWAEAADALIQNELTAASRSITEANAAQLESSFHPNKTGDVHEEASGEREAAAAADTGFLGAIKAFFFEAKGSTSSSSKITATAAGKGRSGGGSAMAATVTIGEEQGGVCPCCGVRLRVLGLSAHERRSMRSSLLKQAATTDVDDRHDLRAFAKWFKQRQPPFTVVIDGANVAYNSQNFVGGRFSFEQVELAVAALQAEGETPLVILPTRYVDSKSVPNHSSGRAFPGGGILHLRRQVSSAEDKLRRKWRAKKMLHSPRFHWADDDWYWLLATVAHDSPIPPREGQQQTGFPNRASRQPVCVVTNDAGRDHRQGLLSPRAFMRWRDAHVRNFELSGAWGVGDQNPDISIAPVPTVCREIQRSASGGDDEEVVRWHIPVDTTADAKDYSRSGGKSSEFEDQVKWLCVSLPRSPRRQINQGGGHMPSSDTLPPLKALVEAERRHPAEKENPAIRK